MPTNYTMHFLGVGNSHAVGLGCSSCVLERDGSPVLMIDCGLDTLEAYMKSYDDALPRAIFLTHTHLDHIGGLEQLFYKAYFDPAIRGQIKLFTPVRLIEALQRRLADYPSILAEGGANFWDCFHLIPVSEQFWHEHLCFQVFPVRHHGFLSTYGLALPGLFLFTGDTQPIPEILNHFACRDEIVFHDCCLVQNPSHTSLAVLDHHYRTDQLARMVFYHYESEQAASTIQAQGYAVARRYERIPLIPRSVQATQPPRQESVLHHLRGKPI